jgi:predicted DCC family thiol-disulfide oxidoreductase YuxK
MSNATKQKIEVFHDGDCPVCRLEIRFYDRIDRQNHIRWTDILDLSDAQLPDGKSRDDLLGRFHVREMNTSADQDWYIGVDAFARIWRELPGFKWFAWVFAVPGIRQLAQLAYLGFIRWQARHRARRSTENEAEKSAGA